MFNALSEGEGRYRIMLGSDSAMGWINDRTVGFRGMRTESDARGAAIVAWRAMDGVLMGQYPGWPRREPVFDQMRVAHDGAYEWFHEGTTPIARLLRPHRRAYNGTFGIELVLPTYATEGVGVAVAQSVARAILPYILEPSPDDRSSRRSVDQPAAAS